MGRVEGKVALVTGAASGLGEASAQLLAREGAAVILADVNEAALRRVQRGIRSAGGTSIAMVLDVTDEQQWIATMARIRKRFRALHVAVNCAGTNIDRSFPTDTR